ncbi:hypothetical protein MHU86_10669 [Fragilaria crotonensis]|nr:hypothetical protein MHU86_10669 [Fragilaria crotonensis]
MPSTAVVSQMPAVDSKENDKTRPAQDALDFIGPGDAVKSLFSVPYSTDRSMNVAVHNIGGTLLVDAVDEEDVVLVKPRHRRRLRPSTFDRKPSIHEDTFALVTSMLGESSISSGSADEDKEGASDVKKSLQVQLRPLDSATDLTNRLPPPEFHSAIPLPSRPRDYIKWKFHDFQLLVGSDALVYGDKHAVQVADAHEMRAILEGHEESVRRGDFVADHQLERLQQQGKPSYAQALSDRKKTFQKQSSSFSAPDLDQVQLQTCIVPSSTTPLGGLLSDQVQQQPHPLSSTPVCTVIDAYLDNIMANVPQLALCLREKGFIQAVKLLETKDIPSSLMLRSTLETADVFSISKVDTTSAGEPLFSPQIMEMNASTLLQFLKANCNRDNATYLLRREAGNTELQLYDISSIAAHRQRKWIWWLATMSYRFALRLGHLSAMESAGRRRSFRARQRSLLENALNLLEDLADMDGSVHETLCASVSENLADTFLCTAVDEEIDKPIAEKPATISSPPYAHVSVDALGKAQDHLKNGIKRLQPLLERTKLQAGDRQERRNRRKKIVEVTDENSGSSDDEKQEPGDETSLELQSISLQLFSMHHKLINVSLRLAEHHLSNYWSSSAMQTLRTAARTISDAIALLRLRDQDDEHHLQMSLRYQFTWLWEHCGHFARSFAADGLWRERGHACGDDVISVLRDVERAVVVETDGYNPNDWFNFVLGDAPITDDTGGLVSLNEVGSIVEKNFATTISEVQKATNVLDKQKLIQRDERRVLVAACVAYSRAIGIYEEIIRLEAKRNATEDDTPLAQGSGSNEFLSLLRQRLGDSCNEIGKILLRELRQLMTASKERSAAEVMLHSAQFWFDQGLHAFELCRDLRNVALLRCNLCQCWKIRANASFAAEEEVKEGSTHAEECLQIAADHLLKAHEALCERDADPPTWDMVSQELATTFLVLGVRRRQTALGAGTTPVLTQSLRLSPGQERGIVDPMERALKIYEESNNAHQAAAANYQLALFYARVWTCQRDETKTREKLSAAFHHYASAHAYFGSAQSGNESTFVLLCLDLSNLYAAVSGKECLSKALARCLDTTDCFSPTVVDAARGRGDEAEWFGTMSTLASLVEERIFKLLLSLVKEEKAAAGAGGSTMPPYYVDVYRAALKAKMEIKQRNLDADDKPSVLTAAYDLLSAVKAVDQRLNGQ